MKLKKEHGLDSADVQGWEKVGEKGGGKGAKGVGKERKQG